MIKDAQFVKSSKNTGQCPVAKYPEYAFIGRSNVGKSSLINSLVNRKSLAKTSGKPGKTQLINHFLIDESWYLVDLPGYGYASVSKELRESFEQLINDYLLNRENLLCTFILIDIRHEPQNNDLEFMQWMGEQGLPFVMVFTKADKLKKGQAESKVKKYHEKMLEVWEEVPQYFVTSAIKHDGMKELHQFILEVNEGFTLEG